MKTLKFDPSRNIYFTSDTHYGHANIIQYCLRPWLTNDEYARMRAGEKIKVSEDTLARHDEDMLSYFNHKVGPDDILIHAGDVAWGYGKLEEFAVRLNCKNVYVTVGNHDDEADLRHIFGRDKVFERFMVDINGQKAVIDHYPGDSWEDSHKGAWQLFGHIHGVGNARRRQVPSWALSVDIGVDSHDFRPWSWQELTKLFSERRHLWDDWRAKLRQQDKEKGGMAPDGMP